MISRIPHVYFQYLYLAWAGRLAVGIPGGSSWAPQWAHIQVLSLSTLPIQYYYQVHHQEVSRGRILRDLDDAVSTDLDLNRRDLYYLGLGGGFPTTGVGTTTSEKTNTPIHLSGGMNCRRSSKRNKRSRRRLRKHWQSWRNSGHCGRAGIDVSVRGGERW